MSRRRFIWPQAFAYFKAQEASWDFLLCLGPQEKDGAEAESSDDEAEDAGREPGTQAVGCEATRWSE